MRRFIYIHSSPDEILIGKPGVAGLHSNDNHDIIELFIELFEALFPEDGVYLAKK